jgi:GTP pyrophosphokinase
VSINHVLRNGDQIEILTSAKQKPTEDWLRFVVSPKAKSKIKDVLKEDKKNVAETGKETLLRKMNQLKIDANSTTYEQMLAYFKVNSKFDLHYNVGKGVITLNDLKAFKEYKPLSPLKNRNAPADAKLVEQELTRSSNGSDTLLIGDNMDVVEYKLAKCCTPIPGDEVFGFVTAGEGIKIHRTNCPNSPELFANHGHRVIKAKWTSQHQVSFLTGLKIVGTDRVGLINDVSRIISEELKVNMSSIAFNTDLGIFRGEIMLYVNDTRHLEMLIGKLEKVEGVVSVARFDSRNN